MQPAGAAGNKCTAISRQLHDDGVLHRGLLGSCSAAGARQNGILHVTNEATT